MFPCQEIKLPFIDPVKTLLKAPQTLDKPSTFTFPKIPLLESISLPFILKNLICFGPTETNSFSLSQHASNTLAPSTFMHKIKLIFERFVVSHIAMEL